MSVFVAWMPDEEALDALEALCAALPAALPAARGLAWRRRAQFHMTLRFLAEGLPDDPAPLLAALSDVAAQRPRLPLRFDRIEAWPGARVLVARTAPDDALAGLFAALERTAVTCGHAPEPRTPAPHVTLAYAERGDRLDALSTPGPGMLPLPFDACLGSLSLARTAPGRYDVLQWWPLRDAAGDATPQPRLE